MSLRPQEVWSVRHNGFSIPGARVPDELLDRADAQTDHEVAERIEPVVWAADARDPARRVLDRLSKLLLRAPVSYEVATHPAVLDPLAAILGPHIELLTNKHNHLMVRPPGSPPVGWRDGEPCSQPRLLRAIVPLGDTTIENGCTRFVPGSHRNPLEPDPHRTTAPTWRGGAARTRCRSARRSSTASRCRCRCGAASSSSSAIPSGTARASTTPTLPRRRTLGPAPKGPAAAACQPAWARQQRCQSRRERPRQHPEQSVAGPGRGAPPGGLGQHRRPVAQQRFHRQQEDVAALIEVRAGTQTGQSL
jgi:hypothetical protein